MTEAYLDIETTGLSYHSAYVTVVGLYLVNECGGSLVQIVGDDICRDTLLGHLARVNTIYTYNGSRFDLPFLSRSLDIDLPGQFMHRDLMYDCWRRSLYGGLKRVEQQLGIPRQLQGISGFDAVRLWHEYVEYGDSDSLALLLRYNAEDVVNLKRLRELFDQKGS